MGKKGVNQEIDRDEFYKRVAEAEYMLAKTLANIRKESGLTQGDIANRSGLTQQMVSRLERMGNSPTLENILKYVIAAGLEIKIQRAEV